MIEKLQVCAEEDVWNWSIVNEVMTREGRTTSVSWNTTGSVHPSYAYTRPRTPWFHE